MLRVFNDTARYVDQVRCAVQFTSSRTSLLSPVSDQTDTSDPDISSNPVGVPRSRVNLPNSSHAPRCHVNPSQKRLQGGGKRKGAFAIYLEPWHADIMDWLDLRKNHGKEENRCRDLFYGLWVNDLFMQVRCFCSAPSSHVAPGVSASCFLRCRPCRPCLLKFRCKRCLNTCASTCRASTSPVPEPVQV